MKLYKKLEVIIKDQRYFVGYKTKLGYINEIILYSIDGKLVCECPRIYPVSEIKVKIVKNETSTFKDGLKDILFNIKSKFKGRR